MNFQFAKYTLAAGLLLAGISQAFAAGTVAGTSISNTASVDFSVSGVNQPDVNSNAAAFLVDRRVNLAVAEVGGAYTDVAPGQTARVLTFTVTNTTNAALDFRLSAAHLATGAADPFGGTDDFDPSNVLVFVDANANNTYEAGTDIVTFLDEVPADATRTVFVVADIPAGRPDNDTAGMVLTATAAEPGTAAALGADVTQTAGADTAAVDTVFGDGAGDTDAVRSGSHSDTDAFRVRTATISVTKTSTIISDPFNGAVNPKRIPGAVVEYCVVVANTGSTTADTVVISDSIAAQPVTFVAASIVAGGAADCTGGTAEDDNAAGADETDPNGGNFAAGSGVVTITVPSVAGGASTSGRFRVTIN
jgi:uncharacterized repeat protein (TIGR01451 family)